MTTETKDPIQDLNNHVAGTTKKSTSKKSQEAKVQKEPPVENKKKGFVFEKPINVEKYGDKEPASLENQSRLNDFGETLSPQEINDYLIINFPSKNDVNPSDYERKEGSENYTQKDYDWETRVEDSANFNSIRSDLNTENLYKETIERDTEWGQYLVSNNKEKLGLNIGGVDLAPTGSLLKGEKGIAQIKSMLGLGNMIRVPLWHSGIWVTVDTPSEAEVVDLYRMINVEKITIGRMTHGLAFSNLSGITTDLIVRFVLRHVQSCSLALPKDADMITTLRQNILVQDIPTLIWAIICSMFPRGFEYTRQCIASPDCHHTVQQLIDVRRLLFVDRQALNKEQNDHMVKAKSSLVTLKEVKKYQEEVSRLQSAEQILLEGATNRKGTCDMYITLKSPTIEDYAEATNSWIDSIETMANLAPTFDNDADRDNYIYNQTKATKARQYIHWVDSIKYINHIEGEDDENITFVKDRNDINAIASSIFSLDNNIIENLTNSVIKYINESTISIIGIPSYDCPACKGKQVIEEELTHFPNFIPLDTIMLFFRLLVRRNVLLRLR